MALTKVSTGMLEAGAASVDLNLDDGTLYIDVANGRVGIGNTNPSTSLDISGTTTATLFSGSGASLTNIPNLALDNSSITINSYATSLGGSVTLVTDDVLEGGSPTNLYFTDARARGAFSGGTGVTITNGEVAIGQSVGTGDNVTFNQVTATVPYDNTISGLTATTVQSAITELNTLLGGGNIGSQATWNVYEFTTVGNDTSFDISTQGSPAPSYVPGYVKVYLNGLLLSESDYTAVDGSTVSFSPAIVDSGQIVSIVVLDSFNTAELLRVTSIDASASTNSISIDSTDKVTLSSLSIDAASGVGGSVFMRGGTYTDIAFATGFRFEQPAGTTNANRQFKFTSEGTSLSIQGIDGSGTTQTDTNILLNPEGGRVGIGTASPDYRLDAEADEDTWIARIYNTGSDANAQGLLVRSDATAAHDAPVMGVYADGGYKMLVKSTGNVGIGTNSPSANLELVGPTGVVRPEDAIFKLRGTGGDGLAFGSLTASPFNSWIQSGYLLDGYSPEWNNGYALLLNPEGGKVGIGTTAPDLTLHIDGVNGYLPNTGTTPSGMLHLRAKTEGATHGLYVGVADASPWGSWLQAADANNLATQYPLLLNPNGGNVGIGTAEPKARLVVQDNITHTSNPPTYRGSLIIASDGSQTSAGGLEFHSSIGGGAGYGGRIVTDSSANMLFFARSNATGWTKTFSLDPTGSAALPGTLTLNNNTEKFVAPVYRGTATGVSNAGYTTLFTATGGGYGSTVKFTLVGTASNVVVNLTTDLIVGHFEDILISTQSGFYTTVTLKVTSDNNAGFAVEATTNHASAVNLDIEVFPFSNEQVTFTNSHGYTGSSLTHTAYYGHSISGTGGDFGNIRTAGNITAERNIVAERAMIKQAATSADVSALASGSVSFSLGSLVNSNRGVYEFTLFGFSDGGAQQNGGVAHLYLMANPDDVSFTVISQKITTIDSVTFSGGTLTVNFTNTSSGFSMQGIKASIRKMVDG